MDAGQSLRHALAGLRRLVTPGARPDPLAAGADAPVAPAADPAPTRAAGPRRWWTWGLIAAAAILPLYYIVGSIATHLINDDLDFRVADPGPGQSQTVAVMAGLITREVDETAWAPNTQPFEPAWLLRYGGNMVGFQSGVVRALATVSLELEGRVGRSRGTSAADADLGAARQGLSFSPESWVIAPVFPGGADQEYRKARDALLRYNVRVGAGQAVFDERADNLQGVLDRIALDVGSSSQQLEAQIQAGRTVLIDRRADKVFYFTKGQAYAYFIVLRAMRHDFRDVIAERRVARIYDDMLADLARAAGLQPMIVQNAATGAALLPNHLATEGFYLMRARAKMREITDILQR